MLLNLLAPLRLSSVVNFRTKSSYGKGFTLIELAIVVAIIGILAATVISRLADMAEKGDITTIESTKGALQGLLTQVADRLDKQVSDLSAAEVKQIATAFGPTITDPYELTASGANQFVLDNPNTHRSATYQIDANGKLQIITLTGFKTYQICNQVISNGSTCGQGAHQGGTHGNNSNASEMTGSRRMI